MNIHKSPAIWGSGDARFPGLRRPHRKSQVDRGATLGAKKCVLMIFGEESAVRIESHILVDFGTLDEFWASTGLNFSSLFFFNGLYNSWLFFWDVFKLHWCIFQGTSFKYRRVIRFSSGKPRQANFNDFRAGKPRPAPVFAANRYPYQLPIRWDQRAEIDVHQPD